MRLTTIKSCTFLIIAFIFLIGCTTTEEISISSSEPPSDADIEEKVLSGELVTLAVNSISIRTDNGMEYCFAIDENTQKDLETLSVGDRVSIRYSTDMAVMAKSIEEIETVQS